ncbi:cytochrome P450 [Paenibacillus montanisoli]|uniref:Cytochrome P450 n=1 Tax=Paenibacillus montanisoli TaxID=2081970 RepID=A0A328U7W6_9BACL|nr:cytochrome P450 [Paenibacillus montanisoli]RAP78182.1 cytochrome P450 [Paenibacillus montanisoli]
MEDNNFWVYSRYEDVNRILKDTVFVKENRNAMPPHANEAQQQGTTAESNPMMSMLDNWMLFRDPPTHTRLRGLVSHAFTPRAMEKLKQSIVSIAEQLAERMAEEEEPDLIASFAFPLPVIVIAELLGVPPEDRDLFKAWSNTFARVLDGVDHPPDFAEQSAKAAVEITDYFRTLIAQRKSSPREDMISELIAAKEQGDRLTEQELIATCVLLLVAGHETTVNMIGNTVLTLFNHPEQRMRLLERPDLIPSSIEEALRFESPVQMTSRLASADIELGGQKIRQGQVVQVMLGAANRDPAQFDQPDRFNIERAPNRHLAFASGAHFCLGAPLARLEGEIALTVLMNRFPKLRQADRPLKRTQSVLFRGLDRLYVRTQ